MFHSKDVKSKFKEIRYKNYYLQNDNAKEKYSIIIFFVETVF